MPKLLAARAAKDAEEERQVHKLATSRHAPGDWIVRAKMIILSWDGRRTGQIAQELGCHPQTVRERFARFTAEGLDGLGDRPGPGRKPRLSEEERGQLIRLARSTPPGCAVRVGDDLEAAQPEQEAHWSLDALARAAQERGIRVGRSQIRRILLREKVRWRGVRSWATSTDPEFAPKGRGSSRPAPSPRKARRSSASTSWGR